MSQAHETLRRRWEEEPGFREYMLAALGEGYRRWLAEPGSREKLRAISAATNWHSPEAMARRSASLRAFFRTPEGQELRHRMAKDREYRPRTLTDEQVRAIRSTVADGLSQAKTATLFGVSHGTVNQIINGKTYRDVT